MTQGAFGIAPFTTQVRLWLECEHGKISLSHVGSEFIIASEPQNVPECDATVVVSIDGEEHRRPVRMCGMTRENPKAAVVQNCPAPF